MDLEFDPSNIAKNVSVATEYFKAYYSVQYANEVDENNKITKQKFSGGTNGFMPFNIEFTVDGIAGMKIYNQLLVNTSFLPNGYTRTTDFIITGIDHKLNNNDWVTNIKTTLIPKFQDSDKVITAQNFTSIVFKKHVSPPTILPNAGVPLINGVGTSNNPDCKGLYKGEEYHNGTEPAFQKGSSIATHRNQGYSSYDGSNREVRSITLHFTVSTTVNPMQTHLTVANCNGPYANGGMHYAIGWTGEWAPNIPEQVRSVQGDNWNDYGVGIEISSMGQAYKTSGKEKIPTTATYSTGQLFKDITPKLYDYYRDTLNEGKIVNLGYVYEGHQFYQDYEDAEITTLHSLILQIISRHPKIQDGITGRNLYRYVFGLENGKPKDNDDVKSQDGSEYGGYDQFGLFSHSTGGGHHTDIFPSPKMVQMLVSLGYVEYGGICLNGNCRQS